MFFVFNIPRVCLGLLLSESFFFFHMCEIIPKFVKFQHSCYFAPKKTECQTLKTDGIYVVSGTCKFLLQARVYAMKANFHGFFVGVTGGFFVDFPFLFPFYFLILVHF